MAVSYTHLIYGLAAICGSVMLAVAYYMAIQGIAWTKVSMMGLTLLLGSAGTMLLDVYKRQVKNFAVSIAIDFQYPKTGCL